MKCTKCESENTQSFEMAHKGGISSIDASTTGFSTKGGPLFASTSGNQQTELSKITEPPQKVPIVMYSLVTLGVGGFVSALLFEKFLTASICIAALTTVIVLIFGRGWLRYNTNVYPRQLSKWKRSFICLRCGHKFAV